MRFLCQFLQDDPKYLSDVLFLSGIVRGINGSVLYITFANVLQTGTFHRLLGPDIAKVVSAPTCRLVGPDLNLNTALWEDSSLRKREQMELFPYITVSYGTSIREDYHGLLVTYVFALLPPTY